MADPIKPASTGTVSQVLQRQAELQKRLDGLAEPWKRDEQLRELLSYCRVYADPQEQESGDAREAYQDVVDRLAAILDGES